MDQIAPYSGAVGLFVAVGVVLIQLLRQNWQLQRERRREIEQLRREHEWCTYRLNIVVNAMTENGIRVPPEVFAAGPLPQEDSK